MSRRIDIELTSALDDGSWTWRAAGAKQPKGVLDGAILPGGAKVGDEIKVEVEQQLEGLTVLSVVHGRDKQDRGDTIELLPSEREFQPVVETRAKRERGERSPGRGGGDRRPRRDRDGGGRGDRDRAGRGDGDRRPRRDRDDRKPGGDETRGRSDRGRRGPSFTPPPEVPQRPKPKRLRPGKAHRNAVLDDLPVEQRAIAELALQGMPAVRQRLKEENQRATAEGRATMPEASVLKLAEELLPRLRVAEWRDRAEAAQRQMAELDLRDLRSVVAAAGDPAVARDETTRPLVTELQAALATKQEQELLLWFGDVDAALAVGRVVRALRLSSQPPKAGVVFPSEIAQRLIDSTNASLAPMDSPDRWIAMLEAAAFSPVRSQIRPLRKPDVVSDELAATVTRLGPALPQVAEVFEIEIDPKAPMPKPLRPGPPRGKRDQHKPGTDAKGARKSGDRPKRGDAPGEARTRSSNDDRSGSAPAATSGAADDHDRAVADDAGAAAALGTDAESPDITTATPDTDIGAPATNTEATATDAAAPDVLAAIPDTDAAAATDTELTTDIDAATADATDASPATVVDAPAPSTDAADSDAPAASDQIDIDATPSATDAATADAASASPATDNDAPPSDAEAADTGGDAPATGDEHDAATSDAVEATAASEIGPDAPEADASEPTASAATADSSDAAHDVATAQADDGDAEALVAPATADAPSDPAETEAAATSTGPSGAPTAIDEGTGDEAAGSADADPDVATDEPAS